MKPSEHETPEPMPSHQQAYERPVVTDLGQWTVVTLQQTFPIAGNSLLQPDQQQTW